MSSADRIQNAGTSHKIEYTVQQTAKVHREKEKDRRPPIFLSVVKWLVGFFLFFTVLTCLVASKVSLLSIAYYKKDQRETSFIMIVLTLMIPEAVSFFKACWTSLFRSGHKWPRTRAILVGLLVGVLEVFGLCFFAVVILFHPHFSPGLRILMMNGVFIFPVLWQVYKNRPWLEQSFFNRLITFVVALVLEIAGVSVLMYRAQKDISEEKVVWVIPVALVFVSIAWCPKVFKYVMEPARDQQNAAPGLENTASTSTTVELGGVPVPLPPGTTILDAAVNVKSARGKAAIINSLWKLTLIPFMCALFAYVYDTANLNKLSQGFKDFTTDNPAFPHFMAQIFTSLIGQLLGILACAMCMQRLAFALPMFFATPISLVLAEIHNTVWNILPFDSIDSDTTIGYVAVIGILFWLAQLLSVGYYVFKEPGFIMGKESSLFWMPTYNGVFLEQYLLLNRRNKNTDDYQINQRELVDNSCIYICTTMYHEIEEEMEQLLHSLHDIDCAREKSKRQIESHIFFDGATKGEVLNNYVLQLISLIPKTLKVRIEACMKLKTPYGLQMRWELPGGMLFHIHLKDNLKVKNKKRWSQVMYMSYVLDLKEKIMEVTDENTYILTTDADVKFTHESVEALLDLMSRDPSVGAVCGRTHPLGVGPIVWYQVFDYAIGHWFQKVANDVLGSVLCSPGCFSVYRAAALRDVLPIYSSKVNNSADFLTKDMGEDRWLCTLMVQAGWRLEYCAAAEDSTFCPDTFDEFFKQRRRWIPSTLANLLLLISEWKLTVNNNDHISFFFILYQALMVFSTIISPSTVILVMASGLSYANFFIDDNAVLVALLSLTTVGYGVICLYTSQEFQLKVAKLLAVVFALLMAYVTVGVAAQIGDDLYERAHPTTSTPAPTTRPWSRNFTPKSSAPTSLTTAASLTLGESLPAAVSTFYLAGLAGLFVLAGLLHLTEAYCLIHGIWYLFCLPSGYLLLIIYSICNITDRSWGTREEKTKKDNEVPWYKILWEKISKICTCCRPAPAPQPTAPSSVDGRPTESSGTTSPEDNSSSDVQPSEDEAAVQQSDGEAASDKEGPPGDSATKALTATADVSTRLLDEAPPKSALKPHLARRTSRDGSREDSGRYTKWRYPGDKKVTFAPRLPRLHPETAVEDWLQGEFLQLYLNNFKDNGYDNVSFIAGMTDRDLKAIGIDKRGHRKKLIYAIEKLPQLEIAQEVPENVEDWLTELGLDEYWDNFCQSGYTEPRMLEDLKIMNKETLKADFGIVKPGHLDKLYKAIQKVQYPTEAQRRIRRTREETNKLNVLDLRVDNLDNGMEYQFWEGLRQACLVPESAIFGAVEELKEKLEDLRDMVLVVFAIANVIWMILLEALIRQEHLTVLDTNVLGLCFLAIYGLIVVIQFLTLLWHRAVTFCHVVARAPWKRGPLQRAWAFNNENLPPPPDERELESIRRGRSKPRKRRHNTEHRRLTSQVSVSSIASTSDETDHLLPDGRPPSRFGYGSRDPSVKLSQPV